MTLPIARIADCTHPVAVLLVLVCVTQLAYAQSSALTRVTDAPELALTERRLYELEHLTIPRHNGSPRHIVRDAIIERYFGDYTWIGHDADTGEPARFCVKGGHVTGFVGSPGRRRWIEQLREDAPAAAAVQSVERLEPPRVRGFDEGAGRPCPRSVAFRVSTEGLASQPALRLYCQLAVDQYNLELLASGDDSSPLLFLALVADEESPLHEWVRPSHRIVVGLGDDGDAEAATMSVADLRRDGALAEHLARDGVAEPNTVSLEHRVLPRGLTLRQGEDFAYYTAGTLSSPMTVPVTFGSGSTTYLRSGEQIELGTVNANEPGAYVHVALDGCHTTYPVLDVAQLSADVDRLEEDPLLSVVVSSASGHDDVELLVRFSTVLSEVSDVSLSVVDAIGRRVHRFDPHAVMTDGNIVVLPRPRLSPGTYFLVAEVGTRVSAASFVVVR